MTTPPLHNQEDERENHGLGSTMHTEDGYAIHKLMEILKIEVSVLLSSWIQNAGSWASVAPSTTQI